MSAGDYQPSQTITYSDSSSLSPDSPAHPLPLSRFNKVTSLVILINDNIRGYDETHITGISISGTSEYSGKSGSSGSSESNVKQITSEMEYNELKSEKDKLVVVDFTATWCPPCRMIAPIFDELSTKHNDVTFVKLDVDKCKSFADAKDVQGVPTFKFFKNKQLVHSFSGANKAELESTIEKHK